VKHSPSTLLNMWGGELFMKQHVTKFNNTKQTGEACSLIIFKS